MNENTLSPQRYSLATLMVCVLGYMILFGLLRLSHVQPVGFFFAVGLFTSVGVAQVTLFGGKYRLRASFIVGVIYHVVAVTIVGLIENTDADGNPAFRTDFVYYTAIKGGLCAGPFAAIAAAALIDIYFQLAGYILRGLGWELPERVFPVLIFSTTPDRDSPNVREESGGREEPRANEETDDNRAVESGDISTKIREGESNRD